MGTTGNVLSREQCSLVESFVFSATTTCDDGTRLAWWKFQKKHPCMFSGMFEMMHGYFSNIKECVLKKEGQRS